MKLMVVLDEAERDKDLFYLLKSDEPRRLWIHLVEKMAQSVKLLLIIANEILLSSFDQPIASLRFWLVYHIIHIAHLVKAIANGSHCVQFTLLCCALGRLESVSIRELDEPLLLAIVQVCHFHIDVKLLSLHLYLARVVAAGLRLVWYLLTRSE